MLVDNVVLGYNVSHPVYGSAKQAAGISSGQFSLSRFAENYPW
jgi:hypothetical protein